MSGLSNLPVLNPLAYHGLSYLELLFFVFWFSFPFLQWLSLFQSIAQRKIVPAALAANLTQMMDVEDCSRLLEILFAFHSVSSTYVPINLPINQTPRLNAKSRALQNADFVAKRGLKNIGLFLLFSA